jgi:hypothetical protein
MSRFTTAAALVLAASLLVPGTSLAGGFATAGLSSLPENARPGDEWVVDVTVLQHGVRPLEGIEPRVMLAPVGETTGKFRSFGASPTARAGVYRARVDFPSKGHWRVSVDDDFSRVHDFGVVRIGDGGAATVATPASPGGTSSDEPESGAPLPAALGIAALAGLLAAALAVARGRRRGPSPASGGPSPASG